MSSAPSSSELSDELARVYDGLFARRIVLGATAPLQRLPFALRAIVFSVVLLGLTMAAGALLGEWRALREIDVWAGLVLLISLIAYERLASDVKRIAEVAIFPAFSPAATEQTRTFVATNFLLKHQTAICSAVGLFTAALVAVALQIFFGKQGLATLLFMALGSAIVTSLIYIPASVSLLSLASASGRAELFPLDPKRSPLLSGLRRLGQGTVVVSAAMGTVGALGPLLLQGLGPVAYVLAALTLCGGVAGSIAQFFIQQHALGALIRRSRRESMQALQSEIAPLFARRMELSDSEHRKLTSLLALYDRVSGISVKGFSLREMFRFGSPLFVPAVTMALTTLNIQVPAHSFLGVLLRQIARH